MGEDMNMNRAKLHRIYRYLIDWLYPNVCPVCGKYIDHDADFCADCKSSLRSYTGQYQIPGADGFAAYCLYSGSIKGAILHFKHDDRGNSYYAFAVGIADAVKSGGFGNEIGIIVPIPSSKKSLKKRGYNQTELIAKELRYIINAPYVNVLEKVSETKEQKSLHLHERAVNVTGAFALREKAPDIAGKTLLVIDDVCTTGSTLAEAVRALKAAGAGRVYTAAFAKTPFKENDIEEEK